MNLGENFHEMCMNDELHASRYSNKLSYCLSRLECKYTASRVCNFILTEFEHTCATTRPNICVYEILVSRLPKEKGVRSRSIILRDFFPWTTILCWCPYRDIGMLPSIATSQHKMGQNQFNFGSHFHLGRGLVMILISMHQFLSLCRSFQQKIAYTICFA